MLWNDSSDGDASTRRSRRSKISTCLYLVGNNGICAAAKLFNTAYSYNIGTRAHNVRAHPVKEVCKVNDMRLSCGIFQNSKTRSHSRRQHNIYSTANSNPVKIDRSAAHSVLCLCADNAVFHSNGSAQRFKAFNVLVDRSNSAKITAAGHRDLCLPKSAKESTKQIIRGAELLVQIADSNM